MTATEITFRDGCASDLRATFDLSERTVHAAAARQGILPADRPPTDAQINASWRRRRALVEFMAAQPAGRYEICEQDGASIGYARVVRLGELEQLTELMVATEHQGRGLGRALLERCWGLDGDRERMVIAAGAPADLSLYTAFGVMPIAGHWHLRAETERYCEARAAEPDVDPGRHAHVLEADHAVGEWGRLEPTALGRARPELQEFLARDRFCLACIDEASGRARSLCWVSGDGDIGPAVGESPRSLEPVVVAALDRVARGQEPDHLSIFVTTEAPSLIARLRRLGFRVWWPSWILASKPLPGLDRYVPTRPPQLL